jgi:hypothetical protein
MLAAICFDTAAAQDKKTVAVYVTGDCNGTIKEKIGARIVSQIVRSREYLAVERTAEFDKALEKETTYQYSGNVDDGQVIRLGRQFGASLVCVADASKGNYHNYYLFTFRLIDIETGLVTSFSLRLEEEKIDYSYTMSRRGREFTTDEITKITDNTTAELLNNVITADNKQKLAVYITESSDDFASKIVRSRLVQNFTNSGVYVAVDRTSDFQSELKRQYSGKVDDSQITELGRQFGVNQVCVARILGDGYTYARIINVETSIILATAEADYYNLGSVDAITKELLSQTAVKKEEKTISTLWAIEPKFDGITDFSEGLAAIQQGDKYGFVDKTGKTVIQPQFSAADDFCEDLAAVEQNGKWGFIDKTGKWAIQPQFDNVLRFSEGLALIKSDKKFGVIDKTGKVIFWLKKDIKDFNTHFSEGLLAAAVFQKSMLSKRDRNTNKLLIWGDLNDDDEYSKYRDFTGETVKRWGFLNKKGEWEIEPQFYYISALNFNEGLIVVTKPIPYRIAGKVSGHHYDTYAINKNGAFVFKIYDDEFGADLANYNCVDMISESLIAVKDKDSHKWGYKDRTGKWAIRPQFDEAKIFNEGLALVKQLDNWGYIDKTGKWIIQPRFSGAWTFHEGLAKAKHNDKWGFIDNTGKWIFSPIFDDVTSFSEGLAKVRYNGKIGFIALPDK